jgi:hypothetical protein
MKELTDYMKTYFHLTDESLEMFDKALEKEKEQIEIAFDLARDEVTSVFIIDGEDYYNRKFNPKETLEQWKAKFTHHCAIKPKTK